MDSDGIRIRPIYQDTFENGPRAGTEGNWSFAPEAPQPQSSARPQPQAQSSSQQQQQQQQQPPRQKHWKPRKCRICFDIVYPKFVTPVENVPGILQPKPQVIYESEDGGRLLSPCKCKGSNKYVHEGCLQQWRMQDPTSKRNYWSCPTCKFNYRLSRLGWGRFLGNKASQLALTISILLVVIFLLGFVADPIIDMYYNPWNFFSFGFLGGSSFYEKDIYAANRRYYEDDPSTWSEHFLKGFAGLGLLSVIKSLVVSPFSFIRFGFGGGGGGRRTGRERLQEVSWLVVLIGVATFLYATWKFVAAWSARILQNVGERVMDVQTDDPDEEDEDVE